MSLSSTPSANRVHIGLYGKRNSGKSSLINAITNQETALVSDFAGTTTDPVYKAMEIHGIGPCMLIDTAGFDDEGELGRLRVEKTRQALEKTDIAVLVFDGRPVTEEKEWLSLLKQKKTPILAVVNKLDLLENPQAYADTLKRDYGLSPVLVSTKTREGIDKVRKELIRLLPEDYEQESITGHLVSQGDCVLLVMPQDIQAPKGRLILPQVQTIRDLLDHRCLVMSCTTDKLDEALSALKQPPKWIITDSQVFKTVYDKKPKESRLTSFSVLFANYKGDLSEFVQGAAAIESLTEHSKVLIAEACTHAPLSEDIGREKLPRMLRNKVGQGLAVDVVGGPAFPEDLSGYDLIIHCGACMFNRRHVMSRIDRAKSQGVPITNYGVAIAKLSGILDKIDL
ncbi:tRNA modification GTPase MnmE [uncultured Ruminococcus sp.]|nr:tRNA modification GTPase MnmE [uncultured Ruminococcus sp.]